MGVSRRIGTAWSDLPQEIVEKIANCLDTETDVLRFRAICSSWRSARTPFKRFPPTPLRLPFQVNPGRPLIPRHKDAYFRLIERTVYRVQLPETTEPRFWLVKTERSRDGKLRILNPVNDHRIKIQPQTQLPKLLNTLDFRVSEVCKGYALRYVNPAKSKRNNEYVYAYA
ncbi:putative F-box protein [Sesamum alatum]|uniref:F-box protein n=1 Tax=Sesamum alatum TaxID=300844 RepID=A0AAE1YP19_9LAMI|nr:putative F-box protein [Sesamum alatum]